MKLTKKSKYGKINFTCHVCGAEFTAEVGEYSVEDVVEREIVEWRYSFLGHISSTDKYTPQVEFSCACPQCRTDVTKVVKTGETVTETKKYWGQD